MKQLPKRFALYGSLFFVILLLCFLVQMWVGPLEGMSSKCTGCNQSDCDHCTSIATTNGTQVCKSGRCCVNDGDRPPTDGYFVYCSKIPEPPVPVQKCTNCNEWDCNHCTSIPTVNGTQICKSGQCCVNDGDRPPNAGFYVNCSQIPNPPPTPTTKPPLPTTPPPPPTTLPAVGYKQAAIVYPVPVTSTPRPVTALNTWDQYKYTPSSFGGGGGTGTGAASRSFVGDGL